MAENQKSTKRELFSERLRSKYPGKEYADDEAMYDQINSDYDTYESQLKEFSDREKKLYDMFARDPKSAQFISDMANEKDPWIAVIERMGIDGVTDLMNDPEKQEEYAAANKRYVERIAKEKSLEEEYKKNFADSMDVLERIQNDRRLGDETIDAAMDLIMKITNEAILGKFTEETINMALNAVNHDADVENARTEGTVAGRNSKIEERLRKQQGGDGMPVLGGSSNAPRERRKPVSMFDLANEAK